MARDAEKLTADERVKRSVRRTLTNALLVVVVLGVLGVWASFGAFTLKPGQAAVTPIPAEPSSARKDSERPSTANFMAA